MTLPLIVLALSLSAPDSSEVEMEPPSQGPPIGMPERLPSPSTGVGADPAGPRHFFSFGWQGIDFMSREYTHYSFASGTIGYLGSWGRSGPLLHVNALLPIHASEEGVEYSPTDYYRSRIGGDVLLGWQLRQEISGRVEGEAGVGYHNTFIWLPGKTGYQNFSANPMGIGVEGTLRWWSGKVAFGRKVVFAAVASGAVDFYDPLHANDLRSGFTFGLAFAASLEGRP